MQWLDHPTEPGWYWWRASSEHDAWIRRLHRFYTGKLGCDFGGEAHTADEIGGEWWGPLVPPSA